MNIFVLADTPEEAVKYHVDRHVVKMILESAQMLSTAHHVLDEAAAPEGICRKTHVNHPCTAWVRQSKSNYLWLYSLFQNLCKEYTFRYQKTHKYDNPVMMAVLGKAPQHIPDIGLTPFAQAMPDEHKSSDSIAAYRKYYMHEKSHIAFWKHREVPYWFQKINNNK